MIKRTAIVPDSKVEVRLDRLKSGDVFTVRVWSTTETESGPVISQGSISVNDDNLQMKVMSMAGLLAVHQCEGPMKSEHDPDQIAELAGHAFVELMAKLRKEVKIIV